MADATRTVIPQEQPQTLAEAGPPEESRADQLRAQAAGWEAVARQIHDCCLRGDQASKELQRRRNTSGQ